MPEQIREFLTYATNVFFNLLTVLIVVRIIMSWFAPRAQGKFAYFVYSATEPVLGLFRRLPLRAGMFDLSAIFALLTISIVQDLILNLISRI